MKNLIFTTIVICTLFLQLKSQTFPKNDNTNVATKSNNLLFPCYAVNENNGADPNVFVVTINQLAENSGNLACNNSCPEFLSTPNELLHGIFQAEDAIDIYGEVSGIAAAEFRICD